MVYKLIPKIKLDPLLQHHKNPLQTHRYELRVSQFIWKRIRERAAELEKSCAMYIKDMIYADLQKRARKDNVEKHWKAKQKDREELMEYITALLDRIDLPDDMKVVYYNGQIFTSSEEIWDNADELMFVKFRNPRNPKKLKNEMNDVT